MKTVLTAFLISSTLAIASEDKWKGIDETVVEKFAEAAGRPPRAPYINTDNGDLLLFLFLIAGCVGGFAAGYCFRMLFPLKEKES